MSCVVEAGVSKAICVSICSRTEASHPPPPFIRDAFLNFSLAPYFSLFDPMIVNLLATTVRFPPLSNVSVD